MASDLCGGGPSPSPRMWQGGPRAQFEQGDEGGGLEGGQSAWRGLFLEVIHTTEALCFLVRLGEIFSKQCSGYVVEPNIRAKDGESNVGVTLWQVMAVWQTNRCHKC